ncbi:hotdog fold thioesterase [Pontibacter sp. G13]|uniref:hotdog fold thioesterase n=1 Tax=Pontibacter sp. G13 TaxID=3074898 RepID=UPI00288A1042|nr:hotdog fold thioesterase [Pontibacter sp. G13]WNJ18894.1 hotdog fold thioesterase [Pontibacter sp. G13]
MILEKSAASKMLETMIPVHKFLGMQVLELEEGFAKMLFPFREEVIGDFIARRWHGGLVATALDSVGGAAAASTLTSLSDRLATIDIRVDYLRGTRTEDLVVEARVDRRGNSVIATRMWAYHPKEPDRIVAEARAAFHVNAKGMKQGDQWITADTSNSSSNHHV